MLTFQQYRIGYTIYNEIFKNFIIILIRFSKYYYQHHSLSVISNNF